MIFRTSKLSRMFLSSVWMMLILFLIIGCKVEEKNWIEKMISDSALALDEADEAGLGQGGRDAAMVKVAHKYFPIGMRKEDVFALLREMKRNGFDITEYRHEGSRIWPSGHFRPYIDEATRLNLQNKYPPGFFEVIAVRTWRSRLVVEEFFAIRIAISDITGLVQNVSVNRSASFF